MALTTLSATLSAVFNFQASLAKSGLTPEQQNTNVGKAMKFSLGTGALQGQEIYATLLSIAASGNTTIDLQVLQDVCGQTLSFSTVKGFFVWLLSTSDSAPDGTAGTACSAVTLGAAASNPFLGPLGGTTPTITLPNGSVCMFMARMRQVGQYRVLLSICW